jgi:hypothetical protein
MRNYWREKYASRSRLFHDVFGIVAEFNDPSTLLEPSFLPEDPVTRIHLHGSIEQVRRNTLLYEAQALRFDDEYEPDFLMAVAVSEGKRPLFIARNPSSWYGLPRTIKLPSFPYREKIPRTFSFMSSLGSTQQIPLEVWCDLFVPGAWCEEIQKIIQTEILGEQK